MTPTEAAEFFDRNYGQVAHARYLKDGRLESLTAEDTLATCLKYLRTGDKGGKRSLTVWPYINGVRNTVPISDVDIDLLIDCYTDKYGPA